MNINFAFVLEIVKIFGLFILIGGEGIRSVFLMVFGGLVFAIADLGQLYIWRG